MGGEGEASGARYRAFISYSHRDAGLGRRLHRRLETYRLPRRLVGRTTPRGTVPARLAPVFRDREELTAAHDLTAEVRAALAQSQALIVVCSPHAAGSPWVAREVALFRELHGDRRPVLAALVAGEPAEAFPAPLREGAEPLAADFRRGRDGPRLALLKLVAGVAGVGLDELVQRDAQRQLRRVMAVTGAAFAAVLAMGLLTIFALDARAEALRQRAEAEALVEFMLTDLRDRLEGVGRLDVLTAVNRQALGYYEGQDLDRLPAGSLERRARVLHAMGEDDQRRGDLDAALAKFQEARRTTAALLDARPDDPPRIFAHAQSEYWVGYVDYLRGRKDGAREPLAAYKALATRLAAAEPRNAIYVREAAYAEGNQCGLALLEPVEPAAALRACSRALELMRTAASLPGAPRDMAQDLANRHGWLAEAYRINKDNGAAMEHRLAEEKILSRLIAADPQDMALRERWVALQRAVSGLEFYAGRSDQAQARLATAAQTLDAMIAFDPTNEDWRKQRARLDVAATFIRDNPQSRGRP